MYSAEVADTGILYRYICVMYRRASAASEAMASQCFMVSDSAQSRLRERDNNAGDSRKGNETRCNKNVINSRALYNTAKAD